MKVNSFIHLPLKFCISDQYFTIAHIFAVLSNWHLGEDFRVAVLQFVEETNISVQVASFLQILEI